jgi:hypothetical protein
LWSIRNYKWIELSTNSLNLGRGTLDLNARAGWRDATQVGFYGLGTDTSMDDRANFQMKQSYAGAEAEIRPAVPLFVGGAITFEDYQIDEGHGDHPSVEERYSADEAPGLGTNPSFLHTLASAGIDWRPARGYARRGGLYTLRYHRPRCR